MLENLSPEPASGESEKFLSSWLGLKSARRCLLGNSVTCSRLCRDSGVSSMVSMVPREEDSSILETDIKTSGIRSLEIIASNEKQAPLVLCLRKRFPFSSPL